MIKKLVIDKLVEMDDDVRTYSLIGYFLVTFFFIYVFFSWWLIPLPFIFLVLMFYTRHKAQQIEQSKKENKSV